MQSNLQTLYTKIQDLMPFSQFEQEINHYYTKWDHLINKDLIALYLIDKNGRNQQHTTPINTLQPNQECIINATITTIYPPKTFTRKNGTTGRLQSLTIQDHTTTARLVLWNDELDLINEHQLIPNTPIKIINGYTKNGRNGIEIHLGRWGLLDLQPTPTPPTKSQHSPCKTSPDIIQGILTQREPTRPFFKDNGDFGFITKIQLEHNHTTHHLILWDEKVKEIQQFNIGDHLTVNQYTEKNNNGSKEIHLTETSTITKN